MRCEPSKNTILYVFVHFSRQLLTLTKLITQDIPRDRSLKRSCISKRLLKLQTFVPILLQLQFYAHLYGANDKMSRILLIRTLWISQLTPKNLLLKKHTSSHISSKDNNRVQYVNIISLLHHFGLSHNNQTQDSNISFDPPLKILE